jgi:hypothetical protein
MIKAHPGKQSCGGSPASGMRGRKKGRVDEPINVNNNAGLADKAYRHQ